MKKIIIVVLGFLFAATATFAVVGGGDIVYKVKNVGDVTFSHDSHATDRGFKCEDCHPTIFPMEKGKGKKQTMADMRKKKACGVCHNGKNAFDVGDNCYICHKK